MIKQIRSLGVMVDCSRDAVYTVETLKTFFRYLREMGYDHVMLYTEDVYEIDGEPYFGYLRGRYSKAELKELDDAAKQNGLELIPCIQTLAHLSGILRWQEYADVSDTGDILLAGEDKTYALIEKMFASCAECFTSRRINIGMDEAHMVGLGKYLAKNGYQSRFEILFSHLKRVSAIAEKYGFSPMMWSDMFFRLANGGEYYAAQTSIPQEVKTLVPDNISLIYWDYYSTEKAHYDEMLSAHKQFENPVIFAGGASCWYGFAPVNRYAYRASEAAIRSCLENGVDDVFITCWKDDGAECSLFASLPSLFAISEFARGNFDRSAIAEKFTNFSGIDFETFLALDDVNADSDGKEPCNSCKYMLYSDPFLGIFDRTVKEDGGQFTAVREALKNGEKNARFGYIFQTLTALCDVLEIKYDLGVRTQRAYLARDFDLLRGLLNEYRELEKRLNVFYKRFRSQWERECKLYGFEKHDIRLGGLRCRIRNCRRMLSDYLSGKRKAIPMLEEEKLPFSRAGEDGKAVIYNAWHETAMIKPFW